MIEQCIIKFLCLVLQLQSKVFQNLVDLADVRNCRLVSQKWKRIVMEACKNKFHVVYPLTDSTLYAAHDLKDVLVSFDVYAFSGKENKDKWVKSGIGPFLQATEWLQFSGSEVSFQQIQKIIGLAINSLKMVSFKCFKKDLTRPFQETQQTFSALRKLSVCHFFCTFLINHTSMVIYSILISDLIEHSDRILL